MRKPRLKRTTEEIETPEGDVILVRQSGKGDIRVEQPGEEERRLLAAVDGTRTVEELRAEFGAKEVDELISQLTELDAIDDAADDERLAPEELARFDRQLRYFSDVATGGLSAAECQERLRAAKIAVLGVGGLGSWTALALACCGIGEMWLIDGDEIEISNLNRQVLYTEADLGRPKVEVAAERLRAFDSACRITATRQRLESEVEIAEFVAGSDVVIDAADWPAHDIELWCNAACFKAGIPYITMSHFPPVARVGPLYVPGKTGCFVCQEIAARREYPLYDVYFEQRRAKPSPAATLGPACGLIGGQVGVDVMHLLTGLGRPSTHGVGHLYDLHTMKVKYDPVVPEPDCPVCGHLEHEPAAGKEEEEGADE
ncbi:MAG: TOMM precursor leader peptide-binding protein [Solirubrobacterales bacterium]